MTAAGSSSDIRKAAELIKAAQCTVALTGAGISTPSGIPDFRSAGSGLWETHNPMEVASLSSFRYNPEAFFEWARPLVGKIISAEPNQAHKALAQLEQAGHLAGIITQNFDNLHFRGGSQRVLEIHGHLRTGTCINCFHKIDLTDQIEMLVEQQALPQCEKCGGILKPDIVLFGEQLPYTIVKEAQDLLKSCDLILVLGSSLEVVPVAYFPVDVVNAGAKLIIINHLPTYLDGMADIVFCCDVADILPKITGEVLYEQID